MKRCALSNLFAALLMLFCVSALAAQTLPIVMLSDLHFDPLHDPAKVARLAAVPLSGWEAILQGPDSSDQAAAFAGLQDSCDMRGEDSSFALLSAVLRNAADQAPDVRFVTVSGDLLAHNFECRYKAVMKSDQGFTDFVEKTTNYVVERVEVAFPHVPVYVALGNSDSSCGDYRMNLNDLYFKATSEAVMRGLRSEDPIELRHARTSYSKAGYYAVRLAGIAHTRMIAIDDVYLSRKYKTCGGQEDVTQARDVLAWLGGQLAAAKRSGEQVWVLGHIPPGIDVYSTVEKMRRVCIDENPEMFLADDALTTLLERYPETVRLGIFGHTHNDELRVLGQIPVKMVASVTPINGNSPSFTVGQVNAKDARLKDYSVFVAADKNGAGKWSEEYRFSKTHGAAEFSAAALSSMIAGFSADPTGQRPASQAYQRNFFPGTQSPPGLVWPQAVCSLNHTSAEHYRECICKAQPAQ